MIEDILQVPSLLPILDNLNSGGGGGASSRGSHRLADATNCPRKWYLRYVQRLTKKGEPDFRLHGTLFHSVLAYHYAAQLPVDRQPKWFLKQSLYDALVEQGAGRPHLIDAALDFQEWYREKYPEGTDDWIPYSVEDEWSASIGDLDPTGVDEEPFTLEATAPDGTVHKVEFPSLDNERITCRTDLIITRKGNGTMWGVDHKTKNPDFHAKKFQRWNSDNEFALDWQVLVNLMILRQNKLPIVGFYIQRVKRDEPYDSDRNPLQIPAEAYREAPALARQQVREERQILRDLAAGIKPKANLFNCTGRFGACDYRPICIADDAEHKRAIINMLYTRL